MTARLRAVSPSANDSGAVDLVVDSVTVRFGANVAVDTVSLRGAGATITGLIGPNGAGKTTLFNACAGAVAAEGNVRLGGDELTGRTVERRAAIGLGRTFQRIELFDSMTVLENVSLGREARLAGQRTARHLWCSRSDSRDLRARAEDALARCGLGALAQRRAADLSTGQRRLIELARALAAGFSFLLLDEPSSGLDANETAAFADVLEACVADDGVGVLLVEHDMSLIRRVCPTTYVLEFGRVLCSGPTSGVFEDERVRLAYLGGVA